MKDAIDKRNEREKIARSIVKRRNIIYTSREELERRQREEEKKHKKQRREEAEHLVKQLREDANKKQAMEIERLLAEQEMLERQLETGMDATGKNPMDGIMQERVEAILSEKSKELQSIIAANSAGMVQENSAVEVHVPEEYGADESQAEADAVEESDSVPETDSGDDVSAMETDAEENSSGSEPGNENGETVSEIPVEDGMNTEDASGIEGTAEAAENSSSEIPIEPENPSSEVPVEPENLSSEVLMEPENPAAENSALESTENSVMEAENMSGGEA